MTAAKRIPPSTIPAPRDDEHDDERDDDSQEITIERRISATRRTTRMTKVDERLLAIARGELDPDDPFGGLIPIYDDDEPTRDVEESWLMLDSGPESTGENEGLFGDIVPALRLPPGELLTIGLSPRAAFFASQIDGKRAVGALTSICALDDLSGLEVIDELLRMGAIDLR